MSIYSGYKPPKEDVYIKPTPDHEAEWVSSPPASYEHLRRSHPAPALFPRTARWIESLPEAIRPDALVTRFARIANVICADWQDPTACRKCFDDLLGDKRGGRRGFPPAILAEIQTLCSYYDSLHPSHGTSTQPVGAAVERWANMSKRRG